MKNLLKSAAMISGLLFSAGLFAQTKATTAAPAKPATAAAATSPATTPAPVAIHTPTPAKATAWSALNVEQMKTDLGLKPEQVKQLTEVNGRFEKDHQMLKQEEAKLGAEQLNARLASLEQRRTREVKALLDADQLKKFDGAQSVEHAAAATPAARPAPPATKGTK